MIRKLKYIIPAVIILMTSCKKQLDINVDPNNPVTLPESKLLTGVERNLAGCLAAEFGLTQILSTYTHQTVVRESPNEYGATGVDVENNWNTFYISVATNLEIIIANGAKDGNMKYVGIAEVLKAYGYSQMVDTYGDIPYSQASQLVSGVRFPQFDKDSAIYPQLLALLDKAITDLNASAANPLTPAGDDLIYGGDIPTWIKAANTIKLKLLVQERLVTDVSAQVNALISGGKLISSTSENFELPFGPNGATDDRNPGYAEYFATQRTYYTSPWFYEILKGYNPWIYTNITDPRIPYYFFNQLGPDDEADNPTEYRDGGFVSIYFGSVGPHQGNSQQNSLTVQGIYPVGGRYDDGKPQTVTSTSSTGAAPYKFITYADVLYLEAELMKAGVITGDPRAKLLAAMQESFKQVDYIVSLVKAPQTVPAISGTAAETAYENAVLKEYDGYKGVTIGNITLTKDQQQLESIMTQKWIQSFGSSVDQYTDYRRTGFPVMFDPNNPAMAPGHKVQPPVDGDPDGPEDPVAVELIRKYPLSLPWSTSELETNSKAPAQKIDLSNSPVFWYKSGTVPVQ